MKKEHIKDLIRESLLEEDINSELLQEDFIEKFISSFIKRLKNKELEKLAKRAKKNDPEFYEQLEYWKNKNKALFDQLWNEMPKKSRPAGPWPTKK